MNFQTSISTCFKKFADFEGRASRSEYWWFFLFYLITSAILATIDSSLVLSKVFALAMLLPWLAVGARRLHDTNKSGWWQLFHITGIGWFILHVLYALKGHSGANRFGADPAE